MSRVRFMHITHKKRPVGIDLKLNSERKDFEFSSKVLIGIQRFYLELSTKLMLIVYKNFSRHCVSLEQRNYYLLFILLGQLLIMNILLNICLLGL